MSDNQQLDEFGLIAELLAPLADNEAAAKLSDDAARVAVPDGNDLVISTDMLVAVCIFLKMQRGAGRAAHAGLQYFRPRSERGKAVWLCADARHCAALGQRLA